VVLWAFAGIAVPQTATPVVAGAAWLLAGLVLVMPLAASQSVRLARPRPASWSGFLLDVWRAPPIRRGAFN
jgi:hypothetical protein